MRTTSKTPGLRIVAGTAYAPAETETGLSDNPLFGRPGQPRNSDDPPLTETAKNGRLRKKRKQIWRMAEAATRYWRVRIDFDHAVSMSACRTSGSSARSPRIWHFSPHIRCVNQTDRQRQRRWGRGMSELTPQHVVADLFGSADFLAEVLDPERAAEIVIQRLIDAGFEIKPAERCRT
jgi:hypothetical protein